LNKTIGYYESKSPEEVIKLVTTEIIIRLAQKQQVVI